MHFGLKMKATYHKMRNYKWYMTLSVSENQMRQWIFIIDENVAFSRGSPFVSSLNFVTTKISKSWSCEKTFDSYLANQYKSSRSLIYHLKHQSIFQNFLWLHYQKNSTFKNNPSTLFLWDNPMHIPFLTPLLLYLPNIKRLFNA